MHWHPASFPPYVSTDIKCPYTEVVLHLSVSLLQLSSQFIVHLYIHMCSWSSMQWGAVWSPCHRCPCFYPWWFLPFCWCLFQCCACVHVIITVNFLAFSFLQFSLRTHMHISLPPSMYIRIFVMLGSNRDDTIRVVNEAKAVYRSTELSENETE